MALVEGSPEAHLSADKPASADTLLELDTQLQLIADQHIAAIDQKTREFMQGNHRSLYYTYRERVAYENPEDRFAPLPFTQDEIAVIAALADDVTDRIAASLAERNFIAAVTPPEERCRRPIGISAPRFYTISFFVSW